MGFAREMVLVAVGWQVYNINRNPLDLGLVGLAEFLPLPLLALPAGAIADRLSRKLVFIASLAFDASITALLILVSLSGANSLWPFLALAFASGVAAALGNPAARSMPPTLVPRELLTSALAIRSTVGQATVVTGPALGGLLFAISPELVYGTGVVALPRGDRRGLDDQAADRRAGAAAGGRLPARRPARRVCASSAGRRCCSARSRSTSSPCSSAAPSRCCRSSPATSSRSGRSGSASCAALRRSARWPPGSC